MIQCLGGKQKVVELVFRCTLTFFMLRYHPTLLMFSPLQVSVFTANLKLLKAVHASPFNMMVLRPGNRLPRQMALHSGK